MDRHNYKKQNYNTYQYNTTTNTDTKGSNSLHFPTTISHKHIR